MDTDTIINIGSLLAILAMWWPLDGRINSTRLELKGDIGDVREASTTAHKEIITRLSGIDTTLATHSERFNTIQARIDCVDDKVDKLNT